MEPIPESPYPPSPYVHWTGYGLRITGTRVSLESILISFLRHAEPPEKIVENFSTVPLSHVYGALAYYYEQQAAMDEYLAEEDRFWASAPRMSQTDPELYARLEAARLRLHTKTA